MRKFWKENKGRYFLGESGWYEFKDLSNTDKWLADYCSPQQENKTSASVIQARLF